MASCDDEAVAASRKDSPVQSSKELLFLDKQDDGFPRTFLINKSRHPSVGAQPEFKTFRVPQSSLLDRLKEFMPAMQVANSRLQSAPPTSSLVEFAEDSDVGSEAESADEDERCAGDIAAADRTHAAAAAAPDAAAASNEPYVEMRLAFVLDEDDSSSDDCSDEVDDCDDIADAAAGRVLAEDADFITDADVCEVTSENLKMPSYCRKKPPCIEELARH